MSILTKFMPVLLLSAGMDDEGRADGPEPTSGARCRQHQSGSA